MGFNYNEYQKEYRKKNLVFLTVRLNKNKDQDIINAVDTKNRNDSVKRLIRAGLSVKEG